MPVVTKGISTQFPVYVLDVSEGSVKVGSLNLYILAGHRAIICDMHVEMAYRKKGYGATLLAEAEKIAKQDGCESIVLYVDKNSAEGRRFYALRQYEFTGYQFEKNIA